MAYFIRTEETIEQAQESLKRGKSVRRWAFFGSTAWEHLAFAVPAEEQEEILEKMGYEFDSDEEMIEFIHSLEGMALDEEEIAEAANLTKVSEHGYAEYLDGLCALESFDEVPSPEDCTATLNSETFRYLVCYEGEYIDEDPDEGWELFKPRRIVWTHDTGSTVKREMI